VPRERARKRAVDDHVNHANSPVMPIRWMRLETAHTHNGEAGFRWSVLQSDLAVCCRISASPRRILLYALRFICMWHEARTILTERRLENARSSRIVSTLRMFKLMYISFPISKTALFITRSA